jgi:hypothetical protein
MTDNKELLTATQILFEAFNYLQPRMRGGSLSPPQPMNPEALAGCILHHCIGRVLRDIQALRSHRPEDWPTGGLVLPKLNEVAE